MPWKLRAAIALAFILLSTLAYFVGYFWPWGWAAGGGLLLFSFPGHDEKE